MTIKRRLFWSNVLMIIIPILLSLLLSSIIINLLLNSLGITDFMQADSNLFYRVIQLSQQETSNWEEAENAEQILSDMRGWGIPSESGAVTMAVYEGDIELAALGVFPGGALLETAIGQSDNHHFTMDHTALYSMRVGEYQIYLQNTNYEYGQAGYVDDPGNRPFIGLFIILLVIGVILATNRLLTHFVFKSISRPLDILVDGVHEIRDGNLDYRIEYKGKDEFAAICADFNEMARQIQELMEARRRDDENRRELIAGISHDLRTPLTAIVAYAEGLTAGVITEAAMQKEYLDTIAEKAKDLEHIVSQLFQFSKLDIGDFPVSMAEVDLGEELAGYVRGVETEYAERGLHITLSTLPENINVQIDPVQLRGVFTNLLENSLKYGHRENCQIQITCRHWDSQVEISFADNGPGVPEVQLSKLFGAFYRTDRARRNPEQGSGLGLAISERIVRRMGGDIRAENAAGGGLSVIITLPTVIGGIAHEENPNH